MAMEAITHTNTSSGVTLPIEYIQNDRFTVGENSVNMHTFGSMYIRRHAYCWLPFLYITRSQSTKTHFIDDILS